VTPRRILIVTNGYAEDSGAAAIIRALPRGDVELSAYPLVGLGPQLPPGVALLDPRRDFPSGGFGLRGGWASLRADLAQGLLRFWRAQRRTLRAQRGRVDLAVALGDVYCLWMASAAGAPTVFVAAPKSEYIAPYTPLELWLMRRLACEVIARDERTAAALRRRRIPASYVGFWMMDSLAFSGETFGLPADRVVVTVLAGSKAPAFDNLPLLLRAAGEAARRVPSPPAVLVAWAPHLPLARLRETLSAAGGVWLDDRRFVFRQLEAIVTADHYGDALARATVVLGMAGGANEHAAGLGKPVVAFPGTGPQFTPRFLREQQRLVGEALVAAADWREAGGHVARLLSDPAERARRGRAGLDRLGGSGASAAIAARLVDRVSRSAHHFEDCSKDGYA
jgi:uncharacterized protein (TIGR03492 family)